jgi:lipoprotein-anchoring transpeptidase ErfK/SrfK
MNRRSFVYGLLAGVSASRAAFAAQQNLEERLVPESDVEPFPVSSEDVAQIPRKFRRQEVALVTNQPPGSIVVDTTKRYLYLVLEEGRAIRYGIPSVQAC